MTVTGLLFAGILRQSLSFYEGTAAAVPPAGLFNSIRRGPARFPQLLESPDLESLRFHLTIPTSWYSVRVKWQPITPRNVS